MRDPGREEQLLSAGNGPLLTAEAAGQGAVAHLQSLGQSRVVDCALAALTTREWEVLELIAEGLSNAEIAEVLTLECATIKSHVQRILAKLGARNRVEVVIAAYEWRLITPGHTRHSST